MMSSFIDHFELCLVKHILYLLDKFGLFPTLREDLDIDNDFIRDIIIIFLAYHKLHVPSVLFHSIIQDEDIDIDILKIDADVILDKWDGYYRNKNSSRPMGITWPLRSGEINKLPPIAHIIMAWVFYGGTFESD